MLLIGLIEITTGTGNSENDYSHVCHQRTDVIAGSPGDTAESLTQLYHEMVQNAERSRKALMELQDRIDAEAFRGRCEIGADEYDELCSKYRKDMHILKYNKVLIVDGVILK